MLFARREPAYRALVVHTVQAKEWRRYGFGGPPEPWTHDAHQDLDRLTTSYYLEILETRRELLASDPDPELEQRIEELFMTATRHKHEIDYTLRHWATPVERARVTDRLGSLMRIGRRFKAMARTSGGDDFLPDAA
jgi:hypothetical protein